MRLNLSFFSDDEQAHPDGGSNPHTGESNDGSSIDDTDTDRSKAELQAELAAVRRERDEARGRADELEAALASERETVDSLRTDLRELASTVADNAAGDLQAGPTEPDTDAVVPLYEAYTDLLEQWRDTIERMSSFGEQVRSATEQVDRRIDSAKESNRDVSTKVEEISDGSEVQNEHIEEISGEMRNLSATIEQIAAAADEVAADSRTAAERGIDAQDAASEAITELERLTDHASTTVDNVEQLDDLLGEIEDIVEFITDIADQTSILALNANIEAARTEESGNGFTVVADEIKQLANETKQATTEIESSIARVQDQAEKTVTGTQETRETVDVTRDTVGQALDQLDSIVDQIETMDTSVREIDKATDSQAESTQDVAAMVDEVGEISDETATRAAEATDATRTQTTELVEVSTRISTLTEQAEGLKSVLEQYDHSRGQARATTDETVVEFWHAMSGEKALILEELAREFEADHDSISIDLTGKSNYRGTLEDTLSAARAGTPPAIAQIFEIGSRKARESGQFRPVAELLPESHVASLVDQATNYYRVDGTLHSLPFNSSNPVLVYNRDAFERAGLDPDTPPGTLDEVREAADRLVSRDVTDVGITFANYSWFVEQWFAEANETLVDNDNGRSGSPTTTRFDEEFPRELFEWWIGMEADGLYHDPGIENRAGARNAFLSGDAGMLIASTSSLRSIEADASFDVGTGMFPVHEERTGVLVGGASLWVGADLPEAVHDAVGEFLTWLTEPEQQRRWHCETGYFPVHEDVVPLLRSDGWFQENPIYETAFEQFRATKDTPATRGAQIGPFDTVRTIVEEVIDNLDDPDEVAEGLARLDAQVSSRLEDDGIQTDGR